jgi:carboxypeptidase Taq
MSNYNALLEKVYEINDLGKAAAVLGWDREVNMPKAGVAERIQQMTTLQQVIHRLGTTDEMGELIAAASAEKADADPDSDERRLLRLLTRQYDRARKLPADFVRRSALISGKAREAWVAARQNSDFAAYQPHLEEIVKLGQEMAELYGYEDEKYDALLDLYEEGTKTAEVRAVFAAVAAATVPLLREIVERGRPIDDSLLHQPFPVEGQQAFARTIAVAAGYDLERGHIGTVVHPFATSFSRNDARITSRWYPDFLNPGLFGTLHESGHAMYEQGTDPAFSRTPLARGTSMGIHESQSRTIENIVGRSLGFWQRHYPRLQAQFPEQLGGHTVEAFWRAINKVQPSFIRVESDELTYNFHIILRFEIEQALINGELAVADLPEVWNSKMQALIGVTPPNDAQGCLQDVHWSAPMFGYFPTYALGNLYGAQFYEAMVAQDGGISAELADGRVDGLVAWLGENIHRHGSKFTPGELVLRATGKPLSHEPFVRYATRKFSDLYGL